ncbi:hypothetical protein HHL22_05770 [Hymenobacter sp. RP-2-7]|uniref:Uncharacterized protein n=1 Tax=Hymenobacter polaris TaxID=2682546 RepID=A0A7Y0FLS8_9BACT|nr:hypothetical protein [Hymenobacter polaris]NML64709.1 hypothetical protein [Hymenobacter polaris]
MGTAILPALASAGLRWPLMRRLFAHCQALGPAQGRRRAMLGTLLLFEATVALATGLGYGLLYPTMSLAMCGWQP